MIKYNNTNNASTTLTAGISASSTTLIVENGDILPTAPFLLTLEHFDNEKVTVREIVKCIAKVGTILTIQRGAGTCVQDDTATPKAQNNTPHSFSVGDCASIYWTSEQVQDIQNEIEKKLNIDDFQAGTYVYGATSTGTDTYEITLPGTLTSYAVGQVFRFMADVDNEGNATLNINGLGAVEIRKNHDKILDNGDIEAGQIVEVAYDGTYFQMDSQVATVVDVASLGNTQYKTGVAGEDLEVGDVCCLVDFENDYFEMKLFGTTESSVEYEVIGNGGNDNGITLWLGRRGNSSGEDLVVELLDGETVIASSQIARSGLTEDTTVETVCSWGEDIETEKGKVYTLRLRTYDNSVDADKGFYVNKNPNGKPSNYINRRVKGNTKLNIRNKQRISCYNTTVEFGFVEDGYISGYWGDLTLIGQKNGTNIVIYYQKRDNQSYCIINGESYNFVNEVTKIGNLFIVGGTIIETNDTDYIGSFHNGGANGWTGRVEEYYGVFGIDANFQGINFGTNNLNTHLLFKGSYVDLFICTQNGNKGDDIIGEVGGIDNIFKDKSKTKSLLHRNIRLGYYNSFGECVLSPVYYANIVDYTPKKAKVYFTSGNITFDGIQYSAQNLDIPANMIISNDNASVGYFYFYD